MLDALLFIIGTIFMVVFCIFGPILFLMAALAPFYVVTRVAAEGTGSFLKWLDERFKPPPIHKENEHGRQ